MAATNEREESTVQIERDVRASTLCNLALVSALVALIAVLVGYQYWQFRKLTQPENLVQLAETRIRETYPEIRESVKKELVAVAPELAAELRSRAVDALPEVRQELVGYLGRQLTAGLDRATDFSAAEFREILRENRRMILEGIDGVQDFPDKAEEFVLRMEDRLESRWGADVQAQARFVLVTHRQFNDKLERLSGGAQLSPDDLLARQIIRIVRTISLRETSSPPMATPPPDKQADRSSLE